MWAVAVQGEAAGTWALRLGEVSGDNFPEESRQVGGLTVLGRALHTQAGLLTRPQDAAPQCLRGKKGSEGNR